MRVHQLISRPDIGHKKYNFNLSHLAFLASQLIPHQMLSQSHSRCALIERLKTLGETFSASACLWKLYFDTLADYLFEAFNILFSMTGSRTSPPTYPLYQVGFLP